MTARGPPRASAATTAPKIGMKRAAVDGPKTFPTSVAAAIPITRSSNAAQPRSWNTFSAVGMYDPRRPRIGRRLTIVGTPARLPWCAAAASIRLPIREPAREIARVSRRERPWRTRRLPAARTRRPTPRLDHRTKTSNARRVRRSGGTGSTPHSGGRRIRQRAMAGRRRGRDLNRERLRFRRECRNVTASAGRLRELRFRPFQGGDQRGLLPPEEVDQRAPPRGPVGGLPPAPELLGPRHRVTPADDLESAGVRHRGEDLPRPQGGLPTLEHPRRAVQDDR